MWDNVPKLENELMHKKRKQKKKKKQEDFPTPKLTTSNLIEIDSSYLTFK